MCPEWDGLSGWVGFRKLCPRICLWNGIRFPVEGLGGNCIPELTFRMGQAFQMSPQPENASQNPSSKRVAVSQLIPKRKLRPGVSPQSGTRFPDGPPTGNRVPFQTRIPGHTFRKQRRPHNVAFDLYMFSGCTHDKPRSNNKASARAEAYKVHREFRTQRRPLNVAFVLRRTVRAGNLICLRLDRRFSCGSAASSYLILVVPGARLGSVSLASVWKCSVYTFLPSRNIS